MSLPASEQQRHPTESAECPCSHLSQARAILSRLGDTVAFVRFDYLNVLIPDLAVGVEILSEVGARHGLVNVTFNKQLVGFGYLTVAIGISGQETESNIAMGLPIIIDVLRAQGYDFGAGHTCDVCSHAIATKSNGSNRGRPAHDCNLSRCDRRIKGEYGVVTSGLTVFNP
jgi:hypothetical protein